MFQTFRGDQGAGWESVVQDYIIYDYIKVEKDPTIPF